MNSPQAKLMRSRDRELRGVTDLKAHKRGLIEQVITKTIVKEQHQEPVRALQFNHVPTAGSSGGGGGGGGACGNMFATLGGSFATVYDDEHFGDHVAVLVQFHNEKTAYTAGGALTAMAWLDPSGFTQHEFGDALLAVAGGDDRAIQIVSVAESRVVKLMKGHDGSDVLALSAGTSVPSASTPGRPRPELLVSLSRDGTAIVWNWRTEERLVTYSCGDAITVAVKPDGCGMFTGHKDGKVREWTFPPADDASDASARKTIGKKRATADSLTAADAGAVVVPIGEAHHAGVAVDCIRVLPGDRAGTHRLATKSADGKMQVFDLDAGKGLAAWRVPGVKRRVSGELMERLTSFNADPAGEFIAVGNDDGEVMVYDVAAGEVVKTIEQDRDFKALNLVRAAAVSADCRHVHACLGPAIVWRMEVVPELQELEGDADAPGTPPEDGKADAA